MKQRTLDILRRLLERIDPALASLDLAELESALEATEITRSGFGVQGSGGNDEVRSPKPESMTKDEARMADGEEGTEARRHEGTEAMANDEGRSPKPDRITDGEIRRLTGNWQLATGNARPIENRKSKIEDAPPRWQDTIIESEIPAGASVLDLGCGDGQLLARLIQDKRVRGQGIELDAASVFECIARGVPVLQSDLDAGLKGFADQSFDYVVLEETLQTLHRPADVLAEMLRVGRTGIVSFPNFAHLRVRLSLALTGRMPLTPTLPYKWYDTPNIHLLSLSDFLDWAQEHGATVVRGYALADGRVRPLAADDNLRAEEVLLVVQRR